jgi:hypothetical protein
MVSATNSCMVLNVVSLMGSRNVCEGNGDKDRVTVLPAVVTLALIRHST